MMEVATLPNPEIQESRSEILLKIISGEYWLLRREERSTIWHVYRQIVRSDGTKLRSHYFCTGCKRLMQSGDIYSLRSHICHVKYLGERDKAEEDLKPKNVQLRKNSGHRIHWPYRATKTLLQLWENNIEHLQGDERTQAQIFRKIAKEFIYLGMKPSDVKTKVESLSDRYTQEAERQKVTGRPSKWQHFQGVQKLLIGDNNTLEENNHRKEKRSMAIQEEGLAYSLEENKHRKEKRSMAIQEEGLAYSLEENKHRKEKRSMAIQEEGLAYSLEENKRRKYERFMAIQKERLSLEKEQNKISKNILKSYQRNLFQLINSY